MKKKVLKKTLGALSNLNRQDFEIIVSDGGSKDKTQEIAQTYADKLVIPKDKKKQTIAMGRNCGAEEAKGDYFVFLDADVFIPEVEEFFKKTIEIFESDKKLVALTAFIKVFPQNATLSDKFFFSVVNVVYFISNNILGIGAASGEFQMIDSEAFKKVNGFNVKLIASEDNDIFERLSKIGKTKVVSGLHILHTSRRAHKIGWPKLLFLWFMNSFMLKIFKRSFSKEWTVVR